MSKSFKSIIDEGREDFDDLVPRPQTRHRVLHALRPKQLITMTIWKAAAVIFFASTIYLGIERFQSPKAPEADATGFHEVEAFYQGELTRRIQWLGESGRWEASSTDLLQLESMYEVLHEQWSEQPTKQLQDAMTLNLIVRVRKMDELLAQQQWQ